MIVEEFKLDHGGCSLILGGEYFIVIGCAFWSSKHNDDTE